MYAMSNEEASGQQIRILPAGDYVPEIRDQPRVPPGVDIKLLIHITEGNRIERANGFPVEVCKQEDMLAVQGELSKLQREPGVSLPSRITSHLEKRFSLLLIPMRAESQ